MFCFFTSLLFYFFSCLLFLSVLKEWNEMKLIDHERLEWNVTKNNIFYLKCSKVYRRYGDEIYIILLSYYWNFICYKDLTLNNGSYEHWEGRPILLMDWKRSKWFYLILLLLIFLSKWEARVNENLCKWKYECSNVTRE